MPANPLTDELVRRVAAKRERLHPFTTIEPARTALIVVDLQNGFVAPDGISEVPSARGIVESVNRLAAALRAAGGTVVFLQHTVDEPAVAGWPNFYRYFVSPERLLRLQQAFTPGSDGHRLWDGLEVRPDDIVLPKTRFSAFIQGSSELHRELAARQVDTVIVTGTVTNICCESTARDAMMLNYKTFFISDGTAAALDGDHAATLNAMALMFADVLSTDEMVSLIERSQAGAG